MSRATSSVLRPEAGDRLRITHPGGSTEAAAVEGRLGQYVTFSTERHGAVRFHLLDDRIKGRRDAWRTADLLVELAE